MLNDKHRAHLEQFRLSAEMLKAGGIRSVSDADTRELLGVHGRRNQELSGILFPYWHPLTGERTGARVKLDHPDDSMKYLMEEGCRHLYFPPGIPVQWFSDPSVPVVFVEAEKSALAIWALAERLGLKIIPIAIGGVWSWKRKGEKQTLPDGGSKWITAPSPDFSLLTWGGRETTVLFDGNVNVKFELQWARTEFSRYLASLGAKVLWADVPADLHCNGPDDVIGLLTDEEALERMLKKVTAFKDTKKEEQETQAAQLVSSVADVATFFHCDQTGYAIIHVDGHDETWCIGSDMFKRYICHWFFKREGKVPNTQAVKAAINLLEARANFEGCEKQVHVRVAEHGGALWLDLANQRWQAVRVTKDGWDVVDNPPVRFLRPKGVLPLPTPERGGSIEDLRTFLSLASDNDFVLVVAFLVAALRPHGPYPVLVINSEQGSGKTTMSRMIRGLIDPNFAATRSEPKENRDLAIACKNSHMIALDNVSKLQGWLSDTLARISTGDAFATRALFKDADEVLFAACRPVMLNGITAVPGRPDLLDRSVIVQCSAIPDDRRRPEDELKAEFEAARPKILAGLLDAVATALRRIDEIKLERLPRMADFVKWVSAAEPSLPWAPGGFSRAYGGNRKEAVEQVLDSDAVADLAKKLAPWDGTAAEFLAELNKSVPEYMTRRKEWFSKPKQVSDYLRRIVVPLRRVGIEVRWSRTNRARLISIRSEEGAFESPASPSSPGFCYQQDECDAPDDGRDGSDAGRDHRHQEENAASPLTGSKQRASDESDGSDAGAPTAIYKACFHCHGEGVCGCISCWTGPPAGEPGACVACGGTGQIGTA